MNRKQTLCKTSSQLVLCCAHLQAPPAACVGVFWNSSKWMKFLSKCGCEGLRCQHHLSVIAADHLLNVYSMRCIFQTKRLPWLRQKSQKTTANGQPSCGRTSATFHPRSFSRCLVIQFLTEVFSEVRCCLLSVCESPVTAVDEKYEALRWAKTILSLSQPQSPALPIPWMDSSVCSTYALATSRLTAGLRGETAAVSLLCWALRSSLSRFTVNLSHPPPDHWGSTGRAGKHAG